MEAQREKGYQYIDFNFSNYKSYKNKYDQSESLLSALF